MNKNQIIISRNEKRKEEGKKQNGYSDKVISPAKYIPRKVQTRFFANKS